MPAECPPSHLTKVGIPPHCLSCSTPLIELNLLRRFSHKRVFVFINITSIRGAFPASISSFLTVLAWYPNTSLRTWCLVLHSLTLMTNMPVCGQYFTLTAFLLCVISNCEKSCSIVFLAVCVLHLDICAFTNKLRCQMFFYCNCLLVCVISYFIVLQPI